MFLDLPDPGSISLRYRYGSETCNKNLYSFEKLMSIILQKVKSRKNNNPDHISLSYKFFDADPALRI
jgi:hypothetical protein